MGKMKGMDFFKYLCLIQFLGENERKIHSIANFGSPKFGGFGKDGREDVYMI
jgi:hypothetical protein